MIDKVSVAGQTASNAAAGTGSLRPRTGSSFKDALRSAKESAQEPSKTSSAETSPLTQLLSDWREAAGKRAELSKTVSADFKPFLETQRLVQRNHLTVQLFGTVTQSTVQSVRTLQQAGGS